jgi:hypothetical protein
MVSPTRIKVANVVLSNILPVVKVGPVAKSLMLASVIALICAGCGGLSATPAVSPLMFLLPGLGQAKPATPSNAPPTQVAPNRDLSLNN